MFIVILSVVLFMLVLVTAGLAVFPVETDSLHAHPSPCHDYEESIRRIEQKMAQEESDAADYGHSILCTHGHQTERVVVCYHGFTNCPRQYEQLAERLFQKGYNVYVPRVPHHGLNDLLTKEIGKLTLEEVLKVCDESIDLARGLGHHVTVLGLSMGGVMAAWNAQFRQDIDCALVIVPSFGWYFLPGVVKLLINAAFFFPNGFFWWDPIKKTNRDAPYSMYHRFSSRGMGHIFRLGLSVLRAAKTHASGTKHIVVMTNDLDIAVDALNTKRLVKRWKRLGTRVEWHRFSKTLKMEHDIIDPLHPYARVDIVYDKILEYIK